MRQRSPILRFRSGAEMLEMFGMQKGGKEYRRLVAGIERISGSTIFFGGERSADGAKLFSRARFHFVREAHIWFDRDPSRTHPAGNRENVIVLSDESFREIIEYPIPTDLEVVHFLAASPGALDLYLWVAYRYFKVRSRQSIPLFGPQGLQSQLGCTEYSRPRRFRAMLMQWMTAVARHVRSSTGWCRCHGISSNCTAMNANNLFLSTGLRVLRSSVRGPWHNGTAKRWVAADCIH